VSKCLLGDKESRSTREFVKNLRDISPTYDLFLPSFLAQIINTNLRPFNFHMLRHHARKIFENSSGNPQMQRKRLARESTGEQRLHSRVCKPHYSDLSPSRKCLKIENDASDLLGRKIPLLAEWHTLIPRTIAYSHIREWKTATKYQRKDTREWQREISSELANPHDRRWQFTCTFHA